MSDRNKTFRRKYTIEIKGITTNHFMERFIDTWIGKAVMHLSERFAQLEIVMMTAEEIDTQKKLQKVYKCLKCGAQKHTNGDTCLFCAAEADHANTNV